MKTMYAAKDRYAHQYCVNNACTFLFNAPSLTIDGDIVRFNTEINFNLTKTFVRDEIVCYICERASLGDEDEEDA